MLTVLSIVGTRPEAVKMAPVIQQLAKRPDRVKSVVCATAQHRQMLDQVMSIFGLTADVDLDVMRPDQTLSKLTAALFEGVDDVVRKVKPDWVLAQGDTTTVMVASLVAFYHRIRFGHVEAGLRTGDLLRPFPEEMNRRVADIVASAYFAPTQHSRRALLAEGCDDSRIHVTGNTVIDALLQIAARPHDWSQGPLAHLPKDARLVLITAHRRESFGDPFRELCESIRDLATEFGRDGVQFVYPVHLNPNVRKPVGEILEGLPNVSLIEPVDYVTMVHLMKRASLILTDSGGVQEEAPSLRVPVLVMREVTERPEGVDAGVVRLVGTSRERIVSESRDVLRGRGGWKLLDGASPYGDGHAAERIVNVVAGV